MKKIAGIILGFFFSLTILAQNNVNYRLLAKRNEDGTVQLKWLSQQLYNKNTKFFIERKQKGKFIAINQTPIQFGKNDWETSADDVKFIKTIVEDNDYLNLEGII